MTSQDHAGFIGHYRNIESEGRNPLGRVLNLALAMRPRISRVRPKLFESTLDDFLAAPVAGNWRFIVESGAVLDDPR
jgi:hypothetical protein